MVVVGGKQRWSGTRHDPCLFDNLAPHHHYHGPSHDNSKKQNEGERNANSLPVTISSPAPNRDGLMRFSKRAGQRREDHDPQEIER